MILMRIIVVIWFVLIFVDINCEGSDNNTATNNEFMERFYQRIIIDRNRNLTVVTDLPTTVQKSNRIMVVIATPNLVHREHVLRHLLSNYLAACEQGYEIHIVFSAFSSLKIEAFSHNMLYYCKRLSTALPTAFVTVDDDFNNYLLALHRYIFLVNPNNYDYFVNQEDDMPMTVDNLNYYVKWQKFLGDKEIFLPGFKIHEALYNLVNVTTAFKYVPAITRIQSFNLLNISGEYFVQYISDVGSIFFMLSKERVLKMSSLPQWFGDFGRPFYEPNVHYHNKWLARHYLQVIPVRDFLQCFTYHSSNNYAYKDIVRNNMNLEPALVDIHAYGKFLTSLLGPKIIEQSEIGIRSAEWTIKYNNNIFSDNLVQTCLENGKQPYVESFFTNSFDSLSSKVMYLTNFKVICSEKYLLRQEIERCKEEDATICHHPEDFTFTETSSYQKSIY